MRCLLVAGGGKCGIVIIGFVKGPKFSEKVSCADFCFLVILYKIYCGVGEQALVACVAELTKGDEGFVRELGKNRCGFCGLVEGDG